MQNKNPKQKLFILLVVLIVAILGCLGIKEYRAYNGKKILSSGNKSFSDALAGRSTDGEYISDEDRGAVYNSAIQDLEVALSANQNNLDIIFKLIAAYHNIGNYDKSAEYLQRAIKINPSNSYLYLSLADTFRDGGKYEEAENNYKRYIELDPKSFQASISLAEILAFKISPNRKDDAIEILNKVLKANNSQSKEIDTPLEIKTLIGRINSDEGEAK